MGWKRHLRKDGIRTGSTLFQLIRDRGHEGSLTHLQRLMAGWRRPERQDLCDQDKISPKLEPVRDPETGHAISRSQRPRCASNPGENYRQVKYGRLTP
jgi:hypothetical protein